MITHPSSYFEPYLLTKIYYCVCWSKNSSMLFDWWRCRLTSTTRLLQLPTTSWLLTWPLNCKDASGSYSRVYCNRTVPDYSRVVTGSWGGLELPQLPDEGGGITVYPEYTELQFDRKECVGKDSWTHLIIQDTIVVSTHWRSAGCPVYSWVQYEP